MRIGRRRRKLGWLWLVMLIATIAGILFFLEWLGSERPQMVVEQEITGPMQAKGTE